MSSQKAFKRKKTNKIFWRDERGRLGGNESIESKIERLEKVSL